NARDAMPEGGTVTVAARREKNALVVTVSDEGTGLPASVQARLFEPFFTTKGSRGTGLGLWLAAGTMERLGGSIRAANLSRGGAIFVLTFPLEQPTRRGRRRVSATRRAGARPAPSAPAPRRPPPARKPSRPRAQVEACPARQREGHDRFPHSRARCAASRRPAHRSDPGRPPSRPDS